MGDVNRQNIQKFEKMLADASSPVIVTHMKPDGDAIGSSTAMYHFLKDIFHRNAKIVLQDRWPEYLGFLTDGHIAEDFIIYSEDAEGAVSAIRGSDLIICLDFNAFHRIEKLEKQLSGSTAPKILIDHHLNPDRSRFSLSFSETGISSASELLFCILMQTSHISGQAGRLPKTAATALMTGMTTDTNNFSNSVFPSTLRMASELLEAGVDRDMILNHLYNQFKELRLRLLGHMMKDLMKITDDGVAYIVLDKDTMNLYRTAEGDTEGFVNYPLSIATVRMSLLLKEDDGFMRVSIRSKKGISANRCAKSYFNGGGHENAAGGRLYIPADISRVEDAAEYIETKTHKFFTEDEI